MKTSLIFSTAILFTTLSLPTFAGDIIAFDGTSKDDWEVKKKAKGENKWVIGDPKITSEKPKSFTIEKGAGKGKALINDVSGHGQSWDIYSKKKFGSCRIELEFMVAKGANSGVYVMGEYEVQILDSYGKEKMGPGDMGAIYGAKPASSNPCKKAGEWQKYVIEVKAPKFDANGKKIENARIVKVELNGTTIQKDIEMSGPTPAGVTGKEAATGPIMFQGDHGAVAFRNVKVIPTGGDPEK